MAGDPGWSIPRSTTPLTSDRGQPVCTMHHNTGRGISLPAQWKRPTTRTGANVSQKSLTGPAVPDEPRPDYAVADMLEDVIVARIHVE